MAIHSADMDSSLLLHTSQPSADTSPTSVSRKDLPVKVLVVSDVLENTPPKPRRNPSLKEIGLVTPPSPFRITVTPAPKSSNSTLRKSDTFSGTESVSSIEEEDESGGVTRRKISSELKREIEMSLLHWPQRKSKSLGSRSTQSLKNCLRSHTASNKSLTLPK